MMNKRLGSASRGFTLIELLVVISIIALLIAILLPALQSAREQARRTVCGTTARSLFMVFMIYEQDFKELPPGGWGGAYRIGDSKAPLSLAKDYGVSEKATLCPSMDAWPSDNANWGVSHSNSVGTRMGYYYLGGKGGNGHADSANYARDGWYVNGLKSYYMATDQNLSLPPYRKTGLVRNPIASPVMFDITYGNNRTYSSWAHKPKRSNHIKKGDARADGQNVVMIDGHVEWQRLEPGVSWKVGKDYYDVFWWTPKSVVKPSTGSNDAPYMPE